MRLNEIEVTGYDVMFTVHNGWMNITGTHNPRVDGYKELLMDCRVNEMEGVRFIIDTSDGTSNRFVMNFCKGIDQNLTLLIPSFDFPHYWKIKNRYQPMEYKSRKLVWRGSTTGNIMGKSHQDYRLSQLQSRYNLMKYCDPNLCDVGFTEVLNEKFDHLKSLLKERMNYEEQSLFLYQINIDGNSCALRFKDLLRSNSVILKQSSPLKEFYYDDLIDDFDYFQTAYDLSDINQLLNHLNNIKLTTLSTIVETRRKRVQEILSKERVCEFLRNQVIKYNNSIHLYESE